MAAGLEDPVVLPRGLDHGLPLGDGQRQGLLAIDVAARLHRGDRGQGVPVVDRADGDGVEVVAGEQLAEVAVGGAVALLSVLDDLRPRLAAVGIEVAHRDEPDPLLLHRGLHDRGALPSHADGAHHDLVVRPDPPPRPRLLLLLGGEHLVRIPRRQPGTDGQKSERPIQESASREIAPMHHLDSGTEGSTRFQVSARGGPGR